MPSRATSSCGKCHEDGEFREQWGIGDGRSFPGAQAEVINPRPWPSKSVLILLVVLYYVLVHE